MAIIYHITTEEEWAAGRLKGAYFASSLDTEGFIHCSQENQLEGVLSRYFKGKGHLRKLVIDTSKLTSCLKYELAPSINEEFPHIYGPINLESVIAIEEINKIT